MVYKNNVLIIKINNKMINISNYLYIKLADPVHFVARYIYQLYIMNYDKLINCRSHLERCMMNETSIRYCLDFKCFK